MWNILATVLLGLTGSIVSRVLTALGLGLVSYAVFNTMAQTITGHIISNYNGMPSTALAIVNLAGGGAGLSVIASAFVTRASLMAISKLGQK